MLIVLLLAGAAGLALLLLRLVGPPHVTDAADGPRAKAGFLRVFANSDGTPLRNPLGVAAAGERVYVAESDAGVVRVFGKDGEALSALSLPRRSDDVTAYPSALADLGGGRIGVVDLATQRVLILSIARSGRGRVLGVLGSGFSRTMPRRPTALAARGDHVIVADAADHLLKEYDLDGRLLEVYGRKLQPGLTFVSGLTVADDTLFASDSNAGRVVAIPLAKGEPHVFPVRFTLPRSIAGAAEGLAVVDTFARKVQVYTMTGEVRRTLDPPDPSAWTPSGIAWMEGAGRYYVTDPASGRVLVFAGGAR